MTDNVTWHDHVINREDRCTLLNNKSKVIWLTGLSASGKSTIAQLIAQKFHDKGILTYVLDGDNVRHGLNKDLGFSLEDREENIRRIAEVANLLYEAGITVIVSFISPYKKERDFARELVNGYFIEVFVDCPIEECEQRDPKGLYKKARAGEIKQFTGLDDPYERPIKAEVIVKTAETTANECAEKIISFFE
ncbi:adenylyl-sulfate kinase [Candidatus Woesearchaeota archaeon]|nr:adenylyl-sulfate kinase [Candidatus Woesearchaeota archaeon]